MKTLDNKSIYALAVAVAILALAVCALIKPTLPALGSTIIGSEYTGTTTPTIATNTVLDSGSGTLGQVTITGANTGTLYFYDATTTDVNKRTGNMSSSSLLLAQFPGSAATGTYQFDEKFTRGLIVVYTSSVPTTTITFR